MRALTGVMPKDDAFLRLVDLVYAAATDGEKWPAFWATFARVMHATAAHVIAQNSTAAPETLRSVLSGDQTASELFNQYYCKLDPWFSAAAAKGITPRPTPFVGDALVSSSQLRRTEFYADFGSRYDLVRPLTIASADPDLFAVSVLRAEAALPWDEADVKFVRAIAPHIRRAAEVHERLHTSMAHSVVLEDALDHVSVGMVVLDKRNRVIFANQAALDLHNARDGFELGREGPGVTHREVGRTVSRAIAEALSGPRPGYSPCGTVSLSRPSGRRPYSLTVSAIRALGPAPESAAAIVMVVDPEQPLRGGTTAMIRAYGLSKAETDVLSALAEGLSIAETAATRNVSTETVRSQTKSAMSKCGVRRQSELVRLFTTLSAVRNRGQ